MRWKRKPYPILGQHKSKVKFAFFPILIDDYWIWLEKYIACYEYKAYNHPYGKSSIGVIGWKRIYNKYYG